jgi:hypothetical protein
MRTLALLLIVTSLILVTPATLQAGDDETTERLENRVDMLLDVVAELVSQVKKLQARIEAIEARLDEQEMAGSRGVVVVEPEPEPEPEPEDALPDVSGTYHLDRKATIDAIFALQVRGTEDEEEAAELRREIASEFENTSLVLILGKDGTFGVEMVDAGGDTNTARGTWTQEGAYAEGPQHLVLTTTHENGREQDPPDDISGTWEEGRLRLAEESQSEFVLILVRN